MIIVTNRGCHYKTSLLNACLRYTTSFIFLTSSKLEKKSKSGSSPFRGCGASDISIHYLQHLDFRVRRPVIFLITDKSFSTDPISSGSSSLACLTTTLNNMMKIEMKMEIEMKIKRMLKMKAMTLCLLVMV